MSIKFMMNIKNRRRIFPLMLIIGLLSCTSCTNEDKAGKDIPAAAFTMASRSFVEDAVQFTSTSYGGGGGYSFAWNFGDGEKSTEENPTHIYEDKGVYIVTLKITDKNGNTNIYRKTIEILNKIVQIGDLSLKWTSSTHLSKLAGSTAALSRDEKSVYINSNDHVLRCYDTSNGSLKWEFNMIDPSFGTAAAGNSSMTASIDEDGTIYLGTGFSGNGKLFAINPNGTMKWFAFNNATEGFWNKGAASNPSLAYGTATFDSKYVYCGNHGTTGSLVTFDKSTGKRVAYMAQGTSGPAGGTYMGPVITNQGMMVILSGWGVHGVENSKMGRDDNTAVSWKWKSFAESQACFASMAVDNNGRVYGMRLTGGTSQKIFCIEGSTGATVWEKLIDNTGKQDQGGIVIGSDGTVYASLKATGDLPGGIIALSPDNGDIKWQYESSESVSGTPAIDADGHILFGTEKGNLYVLDPNGRDIVTALDVAGAITNSHSPYANEWVPTQGKFWSSPIIGKDGTIYIAVTNVQNEKQSLMVALTSKSVRGASTSAWAMRGKDSQHTSTVK